MRLAPWQRIRLTSSLMRLMPVAQVLSMPMSWSQLLKRWEKGWPGRTSSQWWLSWIWTMMVASIVRCFVPWLVLQHYGHLNDSKGERAAWFDQSHHFPLVRILLSQQTPYPGPLLPHLACPYLLEIMVWLRGALLIRHFHPGLCLGQSQPHAGKFAFHHQR